jgi:hypothetical protein
MLQLIDLSRFASVLRPAAECEAVEQRCFGIELLHLPADTEPALWSVAFFLQECFAIAINVAGRAVARAWSEKLIDFSVILDIGYIRCLSVRTCSITLILREFLLIGWFYPIGTHSNPR